jgi:hypothetical protein
MASSPLLKKLRNDCNLVVRAAAQAQGVADFILNRSCAE